MLGVAAAGMNCNRFRTAAGTQISAWLKTALSFLCPTSCKLLQLCATPLVKSYGYCKVRLSWGYRGGIWYPGQFQHGQIPKPSSYLTDDLHIVLLPLVQTKWLGMDYGPAKFNLLQIQPPPSFQTLCNEMSPPGTAEEEAGQNGRDDIFSLAMGILGLGSGRCGFELSR
ncbi:hypothetical protein WISP_129787 [Willisornis vidua]|uniref:Uncharacterized protein n=1 Tax=Willisornis vidua TaxID=1566151 RepID=A0ABQ9CQ13_9PASS|nr:hypothetical protein WISP_129787 [Willisornis vidua]